MSQQSPLPQPTGVLPPLGTEPNPGSPAYWLTWPAGNFAVDLAVADQFDSQFAIKAGSPLQALPTSDGAPVGADPSLLPR